MACVISSPSPSSSSSSSSKSSKRGKAAKDEQVCEDKPARLFHIIFSHPSSPDMKAPKDFTKQEFGNLLLSKAAELYTNRNKVLRLSVFEEKHESGESHFHCPMSLDKPQRPTRLREALAKEKVYVYFQTEHTYYWGILVYLAIPTPQKQHVDTSPWLGPGHLPVEECLAEIPRGAARSTKDRCVAWLGKRGKGMAKPRSMDHMEFGKWVIKHHLKTKSQVMAAVQKGSLPDAGAAEAYVWRYAQRLDQQLQFAWDFQEAPKRDIEERKTVWDMIKEAASRDCVCEGRWIPLLESNLDFQCQGFPSHIDESEKPLPHPFRAAHISTLQSGAKKFNNLFIYGPRNAAKSFSVDPLVQILTERWTYTRPVGKSNFPLQAVLGKKLMLLQDLRPSSLRLSWDSLLVLLEGQDVLIPLPRNQCSSDARFSARGVPIFITAGEKFRMPLEEALRERVDPTSQEDMMHARMNYFCFPRTIPKNTLQECVACGSCYAKWVSAPLSVDQKLFFCGAKVRFFTKVQADHTKKDPQLPSRSQ